MCCLQNFCLQEGYKHPDGSNDYRLATSLGSTERIDKFMATWVRVVKWTTPPMKTADKDFIHMRTTLMQLGRQQGWFPEDENELSAVKSVKQAQKAIVAFHEDHNLD